MFKLIEESQMHTFNFLGLIVLGVFLIVVLIISIVDSNTHGGDND